MLMNCTCYMKENSREKLWPSRSVLLLQARPLHISNPVLLLLTLGRNLYHTFSTQRSYYPVQLTVVLLAEGRAASTKYENENVMTTAQEDFLEGTLSPEEWT